MYMYMYMYLRVHVLYTAHCTCMRMCRSTLLYTSASFIHVECDGVGNYCTCTCTCVLYTIHVHVHEHADCICTCTQEVCGSQFIYVHCTVPSCSV